MSTFISFMNQRANDILGKTAKKEYRRPSLNSGILGIARGAARQYADKNLSDPHAYARAFNAIIQGIHHHQEIADNKISL